MPVPADLKIGISLPTITDPRDLDVRAAARHVERLGLESVWMPDLIVGDGSPALESVVVAATAAAATERINIGFGVLVLALRPVAWVAAQIATLQHLSGNRVILGVGSGGFPDNPFWRAVGVPGRERGRRTDAALEVLPWLIAGEQARVDRQAVTLAPGAPVPPILVGGNSDVAIRRALAYGDGWFPSLILPEALTGRPGEPTSITVGGHAMMIPDEAARAAFVRDVTNLHGRPVDEAESLLISGGPEQVAERFAAYAAAGVERLVLAIDGGHWMRQCELIAEALSVQAGWGAGPR